jgi:S1-C subfamily serine protease
VRPERGSGYLVAPGWVLTAAHVVAGAEAVSVWLGAPAELTADRELPVAPGAALDSSLEVTDVAATTAAVLADVRHADLP